MVPQKTEQLTGETPPPASRAGLYSIEHSGLSFATPGGTALPGKLALGRALRPLMRRVPSYDRFELDEEATVQRIADEDNWLPVLRPSTGRWLALDLVVDEWLSMAVWQPTVFELYRFFEQHGAFRSLRTWGLQTDPETHRLRLHAGLGAATPSWRSPKELIEERGDRLILVVSDCISPAWYEGRAGQLIASWGTKHMVALVQVLPERLWMRTGLGNAARLALRSHASGTPNYRLEQRRPQDWLDDPAPAGFPVPVVTLEPELLAVWAGLLVGRERVWTPGFLLPLDDALERQRQDEAGPPPDFSPEVQLDLFRSLASPQAYQLATYLAAAPLSLPVMRLVQRVMLPDSRQVHLAEFFLSGLIRRKEGVASDSVWRYDFFPGLRELLLRDAPVSDTLEVLRSVSNFVDRRTGKSIDFRAVVADPTELQHAQTGPEEGMFATLAAQVLKRVGGPYAELARQLESHQEATPGLQERVAVKTPDSSKVAQPTTIAVPVKPNPYHAVSPLPSASPLYMERHADHRAWGKLQRMEYVMFVEPRQQGKTSLIYRLAARCQGTNYVFAYVDLVNLDTSNEWNWYKSLGQELLRLFATVTADHPLPELTGSSTWFPFLGTRSDSEQS